MSIKQSDVFLFIGLGIATYYLYQKSQPVTDDAVNDDFFATIQSAGDAIVSMTAGWKSVGKGPDWLAELNDAEIQNNIPRDLLARLAYQESHFRDDIIRGTKVSSAGALGIMQMMPQYFKSVNAPRPYSDWDVFNQIHEAAQHLATLYRSTGNWPTALAAYNAGLGNVNKYGGIPPFKETQNYVAQITADVPSLNA